MSAQKALENLRKRIDLSYYIKKCDIEEIEAACKDKPKPMPKPVKKKVV